MIIEIRETLIGLRNHCILVREINYHKSLGTDQNMLFVTIVKKIYLLSILWA